MKSVLDVLRLKHCLEEGNWQGDLPVVVLDREQFDFGGFPPMDYTMLFGFPLLWRCKRTVPARKQFDEVYYT